MLNEDAQKHRQGFEIKDKKCYLIKDFKERLNLYNDVTTGELLHSEEMTIEDQRTLFDIKGFDAEDAENFKGFAIGEPELEDELEDENTIDGESQENIDSEQNEKSESPTPIDMESM